MVITFAIIDLSLGCGNKNQNRTRAKREDSPDFGGIVASGAATAVELIQRGAAAEHGFHAKIGEKKLNANKMDLIESK